MTTSTSSSALRRRRETRELAEAHFVNLLLHDSENNNGTIKFDNQLQKVERSMNDVTKDTSEKKPQSAQKVNEKVSLGGLVRSRRGTMVRHWNQLQQSALNNENKTTKCEVTFKYRPFGFSVSSDENGLNAIVTKVYTSECIRRGLCIGYCVAQVNGEFVLDKPHYDILEMLRTSPLPCRLTFTDRGQECQVTFRSKPLGFSILRDENKRNARVWEVKSIQAQATGVCPDWVLIKVNDVHVWGKLHDEIVDIIKAEPLPITCTFRATPPLQRPILVQD